MNIFKKLFGKAAVDKSDQEQQAVIRQTQSFEDVMKVLEPYKRPCYVVKSEESSNQFSTHSKMGGYPYLRNEADWPECPNCNKNMQLFLQLNLEELPERKEHGLIQLFYCTNTTPLCESDLEAFFPFSKAVVARRIEVSGESSMIQPNISALFNERRITNWDKKDDYPHFEEYMQLGIDLEIDDDIYELMEEKEIGLPVQEDKLFGWPYWVQSVEYPFDRSSGKQMELLFQISSEHNLPYMFGDVGIGHLTVSPDNKNELGFGWACS